MTRQPKSPAWRRRSRLVPFGSDPWLAPFEIDLRKRHERAGELEYRLTGGKMRLADFAAGHEHFGLHFRENGWVFREWAPNATTIYLIGEFSNWQESEPYRLQPAEQGQWHLELPADALRHGQLYRLSMHWPGGCGDRIPAWCRRVVQDPETNIFNAQIWEPEEPYQWHYQTPLGGMPENPLIYEAHIGMAQEEEGIGTFTDFQRSVLPRIIDAGYNTIQLMAIMEHPYYGSFGYQVSSFFSVSSRFGSPEDFMRLVDTAHGQGLAVIIDLVHSHAVTNEVEGLSLFDGTEYQFFHQGPRGRHPAWGTRCFDYGKPEVLHFLLSNCRYWLDQYQVDGFRFDGITSMLYRDHGLGADFTSYEHYFSENVDEDAVAYLTLANRVIHQIQPEAVTVAEDMSGMPGIAAPYEQGGCDFDFRLAMGIPDCWFRLLRDYRDEDWDLHWLFHELTNRRSDECAISYVESHDQAIVGGKTAIFELIDAAIYQSMNKQDQNLVVDRGIALHKMMRLATLSTAGHGYLNFIGNEFGHPEWIDFPRPGNSWSYHYARRLWSLRDNPALRYHFLADFDRALLAMIKVYPVLGNPLIRVLLIDSQHKVIAFERGELFFLLNFHPSHSLVDFPLEVPPGTYTLLFNSDAPEFGGHNRLVSEQCYRPILETHSNTIKNLLKVYLPAQTAIVLSRILD